jgi:hypothetical protein
MLRVGYISRLTTKQATYSTGQELLDAVMSARVHPPRSAWSEGGPCLSDGSRETRAGCAGNRSKGGRFETGFSVTPVTPS